MIRVENLTKKIDDFILNNISFSLDEGFIMGLIGPNGSGKTTIVKILMGLIKEDKGTVTLFDKNFNDNEEFIKNNIGFVYDELKFYSHLKVKDFENIVSGFYKKFDKKLFNMYLKKFEIKKKTVIGSLSKGQAMRLMLANALSHDAKLLILDEPTAGLDPIVRKEILTLLQENIEDGKRSVLISTHITSDLDGIADYITFINNGDLVFTEDMETIKEKYKILRGTKEELEASKINFIGIKKTPYYFEGLFIDEGLGCIDKVESANIEDILFYYAKGENNV